MKQIRLKHISNIIWLAFLGCFAFSMIFGCKASQKVASKTGAQLWAENCQRCHNTPSPTSFNHEQWETIGLHMQSRALLTDAERDKIVAFMKL